MPHYTDFKPNSYVYTKGLAEQICESYKNQIPITIVRPSIVVGTELEPIEGWNDNFNGPGNFISFFFHSRIHSTVEFILFPSHKIQLVS
jgi:nucleoside-diphosphate-sugar epimerase